MSEALKLSPRPNKEDAEAVFADHLEAVSDVINALAVHCATVQDLADAVNAGRVVPAVARMIAERVRETKQKQR